MSATLFLRIASVLSLINCTLHTIGGVFGKPKHGAEEIAVIETMKAHTFDVMGSMRAYWDFFFGYGLLTTVVLFVQAVLFWQLASFVKTSPAVIRPIVALFFFNCVVTAILCWKYFFAGPAITQLLIAACLGIAYFVAAAR
jgi:hypothetical protein